MNRLKWLAQWLRDNWRGYTDGDVISLEAKMENAQSLHPGSIVLLERGEYEAMCDGRAPIFGQRIRRTP